MSLALLQRDFIDWVRTGDPAFADGLGGGPGCDIYLNNHRASLMASLAGNYEMLRRLMGDEAFDGAAAHHVEAHASSGWTLDGYGGDFCETLAAMWSDRSELADLARLEWALAQAFVAPDTQPLALAHIPDVDWDSAVLCGVASATVVEVRTNADEIMTALIDDGGSVPVRPWCGSVLVWRRGFGPCFRRLDSDEVRWVWRVLDGLSFADFCDALAAETGPERGIARAGELLARWTNANLLSAIDQLPDHWVTAHWPSA